MFNDSIGKTLLELVPENGFYINGYAVRKLRDENDRYGEPYGEAVSLRLILKENPELSSLRVKYVDDFFGQIIFRVI